MKNLIALLVWALVLSACNSTKDSSTFDSKEFIGKYKVKITNSEGKEKDDFMKGMFNFLGELEFDFYENQRGVYRVSFLGKEQTDEFLYKIENDSVFYMKDKDKNEFEKAGTIKRLGGKYDHIQIIMDDGSLYDLTKINE